MTELPDKIRAAHLKDLGQNMPSEVEGRVRCWWKFFHKFKLYGDVIKQDFVVGDEFYAWFECNKCGRRKILKCDADGARLR